MAVDGIGAMLSLGAPAATKMLNPEDKKTTQSPADAAKARADAAAAKQKAELDAIREKGIYAYAQEQKFEALKKKIEEELKKEQGVDGNGKIVGGDDPSTWSKDDTSFEAEVARRMQKIMEEAMSTEAKKAAQEGRPAEPMIIDISV
ncbi:hypothetical protein [Phenylobacterium sp.]|uniref:hypothetical protein n=1 Tax=Phenylobacterium sp. TaxID=1871053 RepID=UPI0025F81BD5|nr:hypothetical protein [Phenylobacterium sp.]